MSFREDTTATKIVRSAVEERAAELNRLREEDPEAYVAEIQRYRDKYPRRGRK